MPIRTTVPEYTALRDQRQSLSRLAILLRKEIIPHALLFTGIEGVGKWESAILFAMAANCMLKREAADDEPNRFLTDTDSDEPDRLETVTPAGDLMESFNPLCKCRSCKKISAATHPDIISLQARGCFIKIAQVRELCQRLAIKPNEARVRVVMIKNAQMMNPEAANALLKMLEEPPHRTIFILTAIQPETLLPTIVSRCQQVRFHPLSREILKQILTTERTLDPDVSESLAAMSGGSLNKALEITHEGWIGRRNWLIATLDLLPSMSMALQLAFAESLAQKKRDVNEALEILKNWLRDLLVFRYKPEQIINADLIGRLTESIHYPNVSGLLIKIEAIRTAQRKLKANTNLRLTLEVLIMELAKN